MSLGYASVPIFYVYTYNMSLGYVPVPIFYAFTYNMNLGYFQVPIFNVPFATRVYDMFSHKHITSILVT